MVHRLVKVSAMVKRCRLHSMVNPTHQMSVKGCRLHVMAKVTHRAAVKVFALSRAMRQASVIHCGSARETRSRLAKASVSLKGAV